MKRFVMAAALAALVAAPVVAQDGGRWQITKLSVAPAHASDFMSGVGKLVEAAKAAGLSEEYAWYTYQADAFEWMVVSPVGSMVRFDNPNAWVEAYQGTPGEALLNEAFGTLSQLDITVNLDIVIQDVPEWAYEGSWQPEGEHIAHIDEMWVKWSGEEAFDAAMKEWNGMLEAIGYPYPASVGRAVLGGSGQMMGAVFADTRANYYGDHDLMKMAEAAGHGDHVWQLYEKFVGTMHNMRHYDADFMPNLSYSPEM